MNIQADSVSSRTVSQIFSKTESFPKPTQDKAVAQEYLDFFEPNGVFTFQTFIDKKTNNSHARVLHGTLNDLWGELCTLNNNGCGIFLNINRTDLKGRKAPNQVASRNIIFSDQDKPNVNFLETLNAFPLKPSLIVESSPDKFHVYWKVDNLPLDEFVEMQTRTATTFNTDLKVCLLTQVMRIPGFFHMKGDPYQSHIIENDVSLPPYSLEVVKQAFPVIAPPVATPVHSLSGVDASSDGASLYFNKPLTDAVSEELETRKMIYSIDNFVEGKIWIQCPWHSEHQEDGNKQRTFYRIPCPEFPLGGFVCHHKPHVDKHVREFLNALNINPKQYKVEAKETKPPLKLLTGTEMLNTNFPTQKSLLGEWLKQPSLVLLHAKYGVGKTHIAFNTAFAVATGGSFLRWKTDGVPRKVLYIDGEMPCSMLQDRLKLMQIQNPGNPPPDNLLLLPFDYQDMRTMPDLSTIEGQKEVDPYTEGVDLIVIDNKGSLMRTGKENEAESWAIPEQWLMKQRRAGRTVILVHHSGKSGEQRGTSKIGDCQDVIIKLSKDKDTNGFHISWEKYRGKPNDNIKDFVASLDDLGGWKTQTSEDILVNKVLNLLKEGATLKDISSELEITPWQARKMKENAITEGLIDENNMPETRGRHKNERVNQSHISMNLSAILEAAKDDLVEPKTSSSTALRDMISQVKEIPL